MYDLRRVDEHHRSTNVKDGREQNNVASPARHYQDLIGASYKSYLLLEDDGMPWDSGKSVVKRTGPKIIHLAKGMALDPRAGAVVVGGRHIFKLKVKLLKNNGGW